jgi:hypothetical protein
MDGVKLTADMFHACELLNDHWMRPHSLQRLPVEAKEPIRYDNVLLTVHTNSWPSSRYLFAAPLSEAHTFRSLEYHVSSSACRMQPSREPAFLD